MVSAGGARQCRSHVRFANSSQFDRAAEQIHVIVAARHRRTVGGLRDKRGTLHRIGRRIHHHARALRKLDGFVELCSCCRDRAIRSESASRGGCWAAACPASSRPRPRRRSAARCECCGCGFLQTPLRIMLESAVKSVRTRISSSNSITAAWPRSPTTSGLIMPPTCCGPRQHGRGNSAGLNQNHQRHRRQHRIGRVHPNFLRHAFVGQAEILHLKAVDEVALFVGHRNRRQHQRHVGANGGGALRLLCKQGKQQESRRGKYKTNAARIYGTPPAPSPLRYATIHPHPLSFLGAASLLVYNL